MLVNDAGYGADGALETSRSTRPVASSTSRVRARPPTQLVLPHMRAEGRPHREHLVDRRQDLRGPSAPVPRDQVRGRGLQRLAAPRASRRSASTWSSLSRARSEPSGRRISAESAIDLSGDTAFAQAGAPSSRRLLPPTARGRRPAARRRHRDRQGRERAPRAPLHGPAVPQGGSSSGRRLLTVRGL